MVKLRHQLAAYSPIPPAAVLAAGGAALGKGDDPREELKALLRREYDADDVMLCGSGTQALQLAITMHRQRVPRDAPTALPAFACFDVVSAALGAGGPVVFYDLDPRTLAPDEDSLDRVLTEGARVVVLAPMYGVPLRWERLESIAGRHGALLIEDAAQGHGGAWQERPLGSLGKLSTISFGRGKGWTGGHGGAVLARGGSTLDAMRLVPAQPGDELRTVAALLAQEILGRPSIYGLPRSIPALELGVTTFKPPVEPQELPRAAAAAALRTHATSAREAQARRANASQLLREVEDVAGLSAIRIPEGGEAGYLRLPVRLPGGLDALENGAGAEALGMARSYPIILPKLPAIVPQMARQSGGWPGAEQLIRELVTVPTHSLLDRAERRAILAILAGRDSRALSNTVG